jgi:hypothetical protein
MVTREADHLLVNRDIMRFLIVRKPLEKFCAAWIIRAYILAPQIRTLCEAERLYNAPPRAQKWAIVIVQDVPKKASRLAAPPFAKPTK